MRNRVAPRWKVSILFPLSLLLAIAGCTKREDDSNLQVLHIFLKDDVKSLDPANAYDTVSLDILPSIMETLYQFDYLGETYKTVPLLAADMPTYSKDRLTVTIPIRHGIKFADDPAFKETQGKGREVKAQDFVYGIKRLAIPQIQSSGWWVLENKVAGINAFHDKLGKLPKAEISHALLTDKIEGIQALDDYTLQFKLLKPYPQLLYVLVMNFASPVAHEQIEAYADTDGNQIDHPIGTGPYLLKTWDRGRAVVLTRNPSFHDEFYPTKASEEYRAKGYLADAGKKLPFIDRIDAEVIKEEQPRWLKFLKGQMDVIVIPKDNFPQAIVNKNQVAPTLATQGVGLDIDVGLVFYYLSFNMKDKLLGGNKFLRQAISAAVDRGKWIDLFTDGTSQKMVNCIPPGILDRPKTAVIKYDFDLGKAKELLKKAGYPEAKGLPVINFDMRGAATLDRQIGEFIENQVGAVGIKLNVTYNTFPAYLEKIKQGNIQATLGGWTMDYPDAENVYQLAYGPNKAPGPNDSNFDNPEFNKLYERIAVMESSVERAALVQKMDDLIQEESPWAMGYYLAEYKIFHPWVKNFRASSMLANKYKYMRIDLEAKKKAAH